MKARSSIRQWLLLLIMCAATLCLQAKTWSAYDIPMVHLQDRNRYVCDPENLISPADLDSADAGLRRLQTECGIQTVFVVVNHVKNGDCFRVAEDIGNKYGVGDKKTRRGLVIVIAVEDRKYFIAPGKGLEGDLTDVECDDIARTCIVRNMKENNLDAAVLYTVRALYSKFKTGHATVNGEEIDTEGDDAGSLIMGIAILLFCFGYPVWRLLLAILSKLGLYHAKPTSRRKRRNDDDWFPPFIFGGGGGFGSSGSGFSGGSFGGGSFGGGGAGGGW